MCPFQSTGQALAAVDECDDVDFVQAANAPKPSIRDDDYNYNFVGTQLEETSSDSTCEDLPHNPSETQVSTIAAVV